MLELRIPKGQIFISEIERKKSRFITWIRRTETETEARRLVAEAKTEFPDARHHCSAWIICSPGQQPTQHSSDDGEPSGTSGKPMLEVLHGSEIGNIAAVVIRYFGGTLLGTGGLVKAYSDAVQQGLETIPRLRQVTTPSRNFVIPLTEAGKLEAELRNQKLLVDLEYQENSVKFHCLCPDEAKLSSLLGTKLGYQVDLTAGSEIVQEFPI